MPTPPFPLPSVAVPHPLVAQAAPAAGDAPPEFVKTLVNTLPIALIVMAAWLLLFRPEREKQRRQRELLAGLKKNDRVLTAAGIYGTVTNVDRSGDRVTLRVDDDARITVTLASVTRVLADKPDTEAAST